MACYYPRIIYEDPNIRTKPFRVPCGNCIGCRLEYARTWAVRCTHEASLYDNNCFVTLTYDDEHLPNNCSVSKREFQLFMKRLRKRYPNDRIRYYGCGEYGKNVDFKYGAGRLGRPHYHLCIFGFDFEDKKIFEYGKIKESRRGMRVKRGESTLYRSKELEKVWTKGFSSVGEVTFESAGYVARYCTKKITGERPLTIDGKRYQTASEYYGEKEREFALMSRRPGVGNSWVKKYISDVYPKDFFTLNGKKLQPPKYYDKIYQRICADNNDKFSTWEDWEILKKRRKENAGEYETTTRLMAIEKQKKLIVKPLLRKMEDD